VKINKTKTKTYLKESVVNSIVFFMLEHAIATVRIGFVINAKL